VKPLWLQGMSLADAAQTLDMKEPCFVSKWRRLWPGWAFWPGAQIKLYLLPELYFGLKKEDFVMIHYADAMDAKRARRLAANEALLARQAFCTQLLLADAYNQPIIEQLRKLLVLDQGHVFHVSPPASRLLMCPILMRQGVLF
jgi:hypothetical protein